MSTSLWLCYARWRISFMFGRTICLDIKKRTLPCISLVYVYLFIFFPSKQASKDIIRAALHTLVHCWLVKNKTNIQPLFFLSWSVGVTSCIIISLYHINASFVLFSSSLFNCLCNISLISKHHQTPQVTLLVFPRSSYSCGPGVDNLIISSELDPCSMHQLHLKRVYAGQFRTKKQTCIC